MHNKDIITKCGDRQKKRKVNFSDALFGFNAFKVELDYK